MRFFVDLLKFNLIRLCLDSRFDSLFSMKLEFSVEMNINHHVARPDHQKSKWAGGHNPLVLLARTMAFGSGRVAELSYALVAGRENINGALDELSDALAADWLGARVDYGRND